MRSWLQTMKAAIFEQETREKGRDTFSDLAQLFESFPLLEKIVIETEHRDLLALFHAPTDTAECFRSLGERGVEINILSKRRQVRSFHNMLHRNGIEREPFRFVGGGVETLYGIGPGEYRGEGRPNIFTFRLLDFVGKPESMAEKDKKIGWKSFKFLKRNKKEDVEEGYVY